MSLIFPFSYTPFTLVIIVSSHTANIEFIIKANLITHYYSNPKEKMRCQAPHTREWRSRGTAEMKLSEN